MFENACVTTSSPHLVLSDLLTSANMMDIQLYFTMDLIFISLLEVERLCWLFVSSVKSFFVLFTHFATELFVFFLLICRSYLHILDTNSWLVLQISSLFGWVFSLLCLCSSARNEFMIWMMILVAFLALDFFIYFLYGQVDLSNK